MASALLLHLVYMLKSGEQKFGRIHALFFLLLISYAFQAQAEVSAHSESSPREVPVLRRRNGPIRSDNGVFAHAVGKMGGCTATLVSPPNSEVTAAVFAAHCGSAQRLLLNDGRVIGGFRCYQNRNYRGGSQTDVAVCFSRQRASTGLHGCILSTEERRINRGDIIRPFGHGNPQFNGPILSRLMSARMRVLNVHQEYEYSATGDASLTPGDSGGPVALANEETKHLSQGYFDVVGINSMVAPSTGQSFFAPFSPANVQFIQRAINKYRQDNGSTSSSPQVCGVNWRPEQNTPGLALNSLGLPTFNR